MPTNKAKKCKNCKGTGMVLIAPNVKGVKQCPVCKGTGKIEGRNEK